MKKRSKQIFGAGLIAIGIFWIYALNTWLTLPNVAILKISNPETTAFMKRYSGNKLKHTWVPYQKISPSLKEAVVLAEDGFFFQHEGIDWQAFGEAVKKNWDKKRFRWGASTITQQVAKNLYLSPSKNPLRKFKEMFIAVKLEQTLSKQRILEIYLNIAEWGDGIYGAQAAAQYYFNTNASYLSPTQSAWLAAILPNPRFYQKNRHGPFLQRRVSKILRMMGQE